MRGAPGMSSTQQSPSLTAASRRPQVAKQRSKHGDKQVYYGVVNLRPDELVKLGTNLDKGEQDLFHKIVRRRPRRPRAYGTGRPTRRASAPRAVRPPHAPCVHPTRRAPAPRQLDEIDSSEDKEIEEMAAHNKRLDCQPRVSSEDATSCLQQCARRPAAPRIDAHSSPRPTLARPSRPWRDPPGLLRAGSSTASGCTRTTRAASLSASESSCNECTRRTRRAARPEVLLNTAERPQRCSRSAVGLGHTYVLYTCMHARRL